MITSDLNDGFFHIPVHKTHRTLLRFTFKSVYYTWNVLPFGHYCSPYYFTKILRPVVTYLKTKGLRLVLYVDDFILFAKLEDIQEHKTLLLSLLEELGWMVNLKKSNLEPSLQCEFIGYLVDNSGDQAIIKIPKRRILNLKKDIKRCLSKCKISARGLVHISGQCVSMYKCIFPAKLQLRNLYRLLSTKRSWKVRLILDSHTVQDFNWMIDSLSKWNGYVV